MLYIYIYIIMKHPRKSRKSRKSRNLHMVKRKQKGGVLEREGFPACTLLTSFSITDQSLASFQRVFEIPGDCVISALQIIGILDPIVSNIMRVALAYFPTWRPEQLETVFLYKYRRNFLFFEISSYPEFIRIITTFLAFNRVVFAGYEAENGQKHVFLIGRRSDGEFVYIDPQTNPSYCVLRFQDCERFINEQRRWYLLHNSPEELTDAQLARAVEYSTQLAVAVQAQIAQAHQAGVQPIIDAMDED